MQLKNYILPSLVDLIKKLKCNKYQALMLLYIYRWAVFNCDKRFLQQALEIAEFVYAKGIRNVCDENVIRPDIFCHAATLEVGKRAKVIMREVCYDNYPTVKKLIEKELD